MIKSVSKKKGFTLIELIAVVVILSILGGLSFAYFRDAMPVAQDRQAIAAANTINGAKKAFELRVSTAATQWANASNDAARFLLIRDRIAFAESMSLTQFTPPGYTFSLGSSISTRVTISGPKGAVTY